MNKRSSLIVVLLIAAFITDAQFYKSFVPSPEFSKALEKIILDFRFNYNTIKGDSILKEGGVEMFESSVKVPGAKECVISYYSSKMDTTASWQGIMYRGDDYKEASRVYENTFRLVKKTHVRWIDRTSVGFIGDMQQVTEDVRFATSTLYFDLDDPRYKKFEAEVEMSPKYDGWEVRLNFYAKKPDTEGFEVLKN